MTTRTPAPDAKATGQQKRELWDLAVEVRRTVPRDLTASEADALLTEFRQLPKLPPLIPEDPATPGARRRPKHRGASRRVKAEMAAV